MGKTMAPRAALTIQKPDQSPVFLTIFERLARKDQTAAAECLDAYGSMIWTMARKFTRSREEAEKATREIFIDIWKYAERGGEIRITEKLLIALIAGQRLIKLRLQTGE